MGSASVGKTRFIITAATGHFPDGYLPGGWDTPTLSEQLTGGPRLNATWLTVDLELDVLDSATLSL